MSCSCERKARDAKIIDRNLLVNGNTSSCNLNVRRHAIINGDLLVNGRIINSNNGNNQQPLEIVNGFASFDTQSITPTNEIINLIIRLSAGSSANLLFTEAYIRQFLNKILNIGVQVIGGATPTTVSITSPWIAGVPTTRTVSASHTSSFGLQISLLGTVAQPFVKIVDEVILQ